MSVVLGVDWRRGAWVGALVTDDAVAILDLPTALDVVAVDADAIGIDIPIGLPATGRRECDLAAKHELGAAHSRVFLAPPRSVLEAVDYVEAGRLHRRDTDGKGLSIQTWNIVPAIADVDAVAGDERLLEVHPELSFAALAGRVLARKKTSEGRAQRLAALRSWRPDVDELRLPGDDPLDALVAAWTAQRWVAGVARVLPSAESERDTAGRPMRIVV